MVPFCQWIHQVNGEKCGGEIDEEPRNFARFFFKINTQELLKMAIYSEFSH